MRKLGKITREELDAILKNHERWFATDGQEGERADLSYTDLRGFNLTKVNLAFADLSGTNLSRVNLLCAVLHCSDLRAANLSHVNVSCANLKYANLRYANLEGAKLSGADLEGANLRGANLSYADLTHANLQNATLTDVKNFPNIPMACPTEGSFIGWKHAGDYIVKLEIPADAKRSSGISTMCRCSKATVLAIENRDGTSAAVTEVCSEYDPEFIYRVGETVTVDDFDDNRFNEYAPGIHFYMNRVVVEYYQKICQVYG